MTTSNPPSFSDKEILNDPQYRKYKDIILTLDKIKNGYNNGLIEVIINHLDDIVNDENTCQCLSCRKKVNN